MPLATCMKLQISKSSVDWGKKKNNNAQSKSASYVFIGDLSEDFPTQVGKIPWRRQWHPTPVFLPAESHGGRSLMGYNPQPCKESDTTERLPFHFSLSCAGEGNGNPLQCSCLENPRDGGAWWAAVYGVSWSQTQLKRLSSSSSRAKMSCPF